MTWGTPILAPAQTARPCTSADQQVIHPPHAWNADGAYYCCPGYLPCPHLSALDRLDGLRCPDCDR